MLHEQERFFGPATRLFSRIRVTCPSVRVLPSILSEDCMVFILFSFLSWAGGLYKCRASACPSFLEIAAMSVKIAGVLHHKEDVF